MSRKLTPSDLGRPDLRVGGFQLWVHGLEFPGACDYYDGNRLRVTAHCGAGGASVWVQGSILMVTVIAGFGKECEAILRGDSNSAILDLFEPELKVLLEVTDRLGHARVRVEITPYPLAQFRRMEFDIDQGRLPGIIEQCSEITLKYPIRGSGN